MALGTATGQPGRAEVQEHMYTRMVSNAGLQHMHIEQLSELKVGHVFHSEKQYLVVLDTYNRPDKRDSSRGHTV